jgi:MerR family transcriptional regulator, light-induced transcriptional regulator
LDALGRLVYATRQRNAGVPVFDYRGALPETGASTVPRLGPEPGAALETLRGYVLGARRSGSRAAAG